MIEQRSENIVLSDEQIEVAAMYVVAWNGNNPDDLQGAKNRIRSLLHNSPEARGIALAALRAR
jgi:hypothetical protein